MGDETFEDEKFVELFVKRRTVNVGKNLRPTLSLVNFDRSL